MLQRSFFKAGGEDQPQQSRQWRLLRTLFLSVMKYKLPDDFAMKSELDSKEWEQYSHPQIDALAYELYGLTQEEIKIVEGNS